MLEYRLLAEGALGTEISDLQRLLLGQAGRHDFAEHMHEDFIAERPFVAIDDHAQNLRLALGTVIIHCRHQRSLGQTNLVRPARTFRNQVLDVAIDAVDARTHLGQIFWCRCLPIIVTHCRVPHVPKSGVS